KLDLLRKNLDDDTRLLASGSKYEEIKEEICEKFNSKLSLRRHILAQLKLLNRLNFGKSSLKAFQRSMAIVKGAYQSLLDSGTGNEYLNLEFKKIVADKFPRQWFLKFCEEHRGRHQELPVGIFVKFLRDKINDHEN